ncbi:MAG: hypothetical protein Q4D04_09395, partial [Clostridia bacterium]|nr:hypothetical protein [Clostridia bacterium]
MTRRRPLSAVRQNPTNAVLFILLAALILLVIACVSVSAGITRAAIEDEISRSAQTAVESVRSDIDFLMRQTEDSARTLLGTIYPYLNTDADKEGQINQYNEMSRIFSGYVGRYMITKLRLYVPSDRIYSRQGDTFYSLDDLLNDDEFLRLLNNGSSGIFWQGTHSLYLGLG